MATSGASHDEMCLMGKTRLRATRTGKTTGLRIRNLGSYLRGCLAVRFSCRRTIICNGHCGAHQDLPLRLLPPSSSSGKCWFGCCQLTAATLSANRPVQNCYSPPGHVPSQWLAFIWTQKSHPLPYFVIALYGHPGPRAPLTMGASVGIPLWNSFSICSLLLSAPFLTGAPLPSTPQ